MKKEWKICIAPYKLAYSILFLLLFALVRGVTLTSEIGPALMPGVAVLASVFCAETSVMDRNGQRGENHLSETGKEPDPHDLPEMDYSGSVFVCDRSCSIFYFLLAEALPHDRAYLCFRVRRLRSGTCGNCFILESDLGCHFQSGKEPVGGDWSIGSSMDYDQFHNRGETVWAVQPVCLFLL